MLDFDYTFPSGKFPLHTNPLADRAKCGYLPGEQMIKLRDCLVAVLAIAATLCVVAVAGQHASPLNSAVFDWNAMSSSPTNVGSVRSIYRGPTVTLKELEMHITTLNAGETSHAPHKHPNEELVLIKEGTVETLSNGEWKKVGPGSIIFNASNQLHGLRSVGPGPATYFVVNWISSETPAPATP